MKTLLKKKKALTFLLAGTLVLAAAGCGKSDSSENATDSTGVTAEKVTAQTQNTTESKKSEKKSSKTQITDTSYAEKIFDTSYVHEINIEISEEDWEDLKANPTEKTKYKTNVTIDGETISEVSFATKGNTSLSFVASDKDSDRYSFKLNFGKYVDDQTYYGMQKLNLNNLYADATYMKDYLSYAIFRAAGADASLASYVHLSINGESFGLYLAVEEVDESFLARNTDGEGELYKPETDSLDNDGKMGGGNMPDMSQFQDGQMPDGMTPPDGAQFPGNGQMPDGMTPPDGMQRPEDAQSADNGKQTSGDQDVTDDLEKESSDGKSRKKRDKDSQDDDQNSKSRDGKSDFGNFNGKGGFGGSGSGASLAYTDDQIDSYSDIFDNAETDADEEDEQRVISALKGLSEGTDLESYLDTDAVIRYFAAHNFVLNYDSYTGNMLHNYYLYENDGKLSMIPWDYNLAFGGFGGGGGNPMNGKTDANGDTANAAANTETANTENGSDATSLINTGIDTPLSGSTTDSRPMWAWIANNEEYLQKYHEVYDELLKNYFENGAYEAEIDRVYNMIKPYVESDATAFFTAEEFEKACESLKTFCKLRSESIRKQLDGTLSASTSEQKSEDQVDASGLNVKDMGSQGGQDGKGGMNFGPGGNFDGKNFDGKSFDNKGSDDKSSDNKGSDDKSSDSKNKSTEESTEP